MSEILRQDGEAPFDDLEGNNAFKRLFKKFLDIFGVTALVTTAGAATRGVATLSSGVVSIPTSAVNPNSVIVLSPRGSLNAGTLDVTINPGVSFNITSSSGLDARLVGWAILS